MRKYPQTTGYYVYCHITPNEMFYIGYSSNKPCERWRPSHYKTSSLRPYIEKYGWDNIKHVVLKDGLTKEQAEVLECLLIDEATRQGFSINKHRSGGIKRDNVNAYQREINKCIEHKEYMREYEQRPERKEYKRKYYERSDIKERQREWQRQYYLKKKGKI